MTMLYLSNKVKELHTSFLSFFEVAYYWRFQKEPSVNDDYVQFMLHGVIPKYVLAYLDHLQHEEARQPSLF
jgi:hypothetical protein